MFFNPLKKESRASIDPNYKVLATAQLTITDQTDASNLAGNLTIVNGSKSQIYLTGASQPYNPDWKMTSYGTWTNEEENRLFNIENKAINWPKLIVPDVTRKVTEKDNLVTVISDVPEKILAATSYIVFGDEGLNLLAREKGDTPDSPGSTPGKIDGAYEPSEPIKIDKIDCGVGEKDVTIHRYYSSYVNSNQIYLVNSKHEPIYLIEIEKN